MKEDKDFQAKSREKRFVTKKLDIGYVFLSPPFFPFLAFLVFRVSRILQVDRTKGFQPARSRRWGWQLWRIFFIHVTCLRARKKHILPIQGIVCMSFHPAKPSILKSPSVGGKERGRGIYSFAFPSRFFDLRREFWWINNRVFLKRRPILSQFIFFFLSPPPLPCSVI